MKFTDWLALPDDAPSYEDAKYVEGFDAETRAGYETWHVSVYTCNLCGAAITDTELHTAWHRDLGR